MRLARLLQAGARFRSLEFGPPGDVWVVLEWYEDHEGRRVACLAENLDHPDEEVFGANEMVEVAL